MDGKRGHVTCGNWLAIERQESFQNLQACRRNSCSRLFRPVGTLQHFAWLDMGENGSSSIKLKCFLKSTRDASYILAKDGWPGYE